MFEKGCLWPLWKKLVIEKGAGTIQQVIGKVEKILDHDKTMYQQGDTTQRAYITFEQI